MMSPRTILLALAGLLAAAEVRASSDHFVESQVSTAELSLIIRTHLQTQAKFCPQSVPCPNSNGTCIIDRLEYPIVGTWSRGAAINVPINNHTTLPSTKILYDQPLIAHLKTIACAYTPGCETTTQYPAALTIELSAGQGTSLCFTPSLPYGLPMNMNTSIEPFCVQLDLDALKVLTGNQASSISGEALSLNNAGSRVGFRFELDRPQSAYNSARVAAWQSFLDGQLGPNNNGNLDWSVFAHESLLREAAKTTVEQAFAQAPDLTMLGDPSTGWSGFGSAGGQVDVSVGAEYDSCVDISPVSLSALTSINGASNGLQTNGTLTWDVDEWDAFWCGFQQGFILGAIIGPIVASSVDLQDLGQSIGPCQVTGDHSFYCEQQTHPQVTVLGHGWSMKSFLSSVYGHSSGLEMSGNLTQMGSGIPEINVSLQTPTFGYRGSCNSAECGYLGGVYLSGNAKLCGVEFTNDPLHIFEVDYPPTLTMPASFGVKVKPGLSDTDKQNYINHPPYGMRVTVFSSSGVDTYEFEPTELLPINSNYWLDDESIMCHVWQIGDWATNCLQPKWRPGESKYHPEWVIDPWDQVVIIWDSRLHLELDFALIEETQLAAIWDAAGRSVTGIRITGLVHIAKEERVANTQAFEIVAGMPRGAVAHSLEEAIQIGFRRGVAQTIAVEPAFVPRGATSAEFEVSFDQTRLLDMAR